MLKKPREGAHGGAFFYDNGPAEVMGWVLKAVGDAPLADLMSEHVFQPLGVERDGL